MKAQGWKTATEQPHSYGQTFAEPLRTMSSVRSPQEKKRLAYERDHYAKSKYDKARNAWRTKKNKARRAYRHSVDSLTRTAALDGETDSKISAVRQQAIRRWPVPSLRENVLRKLERRVRTVGVKKSRRALSAESAVAAHSTTPPRPEKDFCVDSVASTLYSLGRQAERGSPALSRQIVVRRFWQYLRFLQSHGLTTRTIAHSMAEIEDTTELRNSDLTDAGFRFVRHSHWRWMQRLYKDAGAKREDGYLKKWYENVRGRL